MLALLKPLTDEAAINDLLGHVNPMWSLTEVKARVERRIPETADCTTLVLRPNRWRGFRAGQHVGVTVEIDGVRHQRTYSLSSAPASGTVAITVKRAGKVSAFLNDEAMTGTVLTLTPPHGDFVLPATLPRKLLMISAGSGITPVMSMLRELDCAATRPDVVFVHACRSPADAIFGGELAALAAGWPGLTVHTVYSGRDGRLTPARLQALLPDYAMLPTYLCGPAGFMAAFEAQYAAAGARERLFLERFGAAPLQVADGATARIACTRSRRAFAADTVNPLLVQAEGAGLNPKSGCRIGICMSCKCRKNAGTVQNLVTGEISSAPGEMIQLCISAARSDLDLDL